MDAFARFGAKPKSRQRGRSALAEDGAVVLSCSAPQFKHSGPGILRYADAVSRGTGDKPGAVLLGEHLVLARDGQLPIRMVVIADANTGKARYNIYARPDVIGRLISFDGDNFVVDFTKLPVEPPEKREGRGRRG